MVKKPEGRQKSQTLTIRLDDKSRFMLEFIARETGQSLTTIVERAIQDKADQTYANHGNSVTWRDFWHPNEGVRTLKMLLSNSVRTSFEEDETASFIRKHWRFFSEDPDLKILNHDNVNVLWNNIVALIDLWKETRSTTPTAVIIEMTALLKEAGLSPADDSDPSLWESEKLPF